MAGTDVFEGQALWQPGGAEEDSRLREGNRHLHLAYDDEEEDHSGNIVQTRGRLSLTTVIELLSPSIPDYFNDRRMDYLLTSWWQ